ncbi:superoxide dismutase family protein [Marinivivus vitaminiproducens]|uniref:superoxide dismutase family protein n=1 Tax=Marinivivus vitaminiproducens TaxID=3035935 RepID=UPI0027A390C6|nr:superoxide dismutase family protein [Geminicoccaceae bacterium SCSIO 64248]
MLRTATALGALALATVAIFPSHAAERATARLADPQGGDLGTVTLMPLAAGGVLLSAELRNVPPGTHGFHIHGTGQCDGAGGFESAGGHFNPSDNAHGWNNADGPHAGDLPNIHVPEGGALDIELFVPDVSLDEADENTLLGESGTAILIHAMADDYASDPSGMAGDRIACGVIEAE